MQAAAAARHELRPTQSRNVMKNKTNIRAGKKGSIDNAIFSSAPVNRCVGL